MRLIALLVLTSAAAASLAQQIPPQWSSGGSYIGGGLVRGVDGNYYRATKNSIGHDPTKDNHTYWELYYVRAPVTLPVAMTGARFSSLKSAWAFLSSAHIAATATANISITGGAGTYSETFTSPLNLNQENGGQITITGDAIAKVTLQFNTNIDGVQISAGHRLGAITGLTIDGTTAGQGGIGLSVRDHGSLGTSNLRIRNFSTGMFVSGASVAICPSLQVANCTFTGAKIYENSHADLTAASLTSTGSTGIDVELYSTVDCTSASVSGATTYGITATGGSFVNAAGATVSNTGTAFIAGVRSSIDANTTTCTSNTFGYYAYSASYIRAVHNTVTSTGTPYTPVVNTTSSDTSHIEG